MPQLDTKTQPSPVNPFELSDEALRARLEKVDGGYATATIRGLLRLPDGSAVFVKRGMSDFTIDGVQREAVAYARLQEAGYTNLPEFIGADPSTIVIEDLSERDFSSTWTDDKLSAAMDAMQSLAELEPPADLERFALPNGWNDLAMHPELLAQLKEKMGADFDPAIAADFADRARIVEDYLDEPGVVSHGDVRGDNFAYDPESKSGMFVDWNWCGTAPESKDPTELLISVAESGYEVTDEMLAQYCSKEACLMLAGYWFAECTKPAWEGGEEVREHQLVSANIAWDWYNRLATESSDR